MATGFVIGYDPGGEGAHGLAQIELSDSRICGLRVQTLKTVEAVLDSVASLRPLIAIGVDTLTSWSTGPSAWRPADRWLRARYPEVRNSVVSPNSLYGAMALNGMAALIAIRSSADVVLVTETHPKVLYWHLSGRKYDFVSNAATMKQDLSGWIGHEIECNTDDGWDAALSAWAALQGVTGNWGHDLHSLPTLPTEQLLHPSGPSKYLWPT